MRARQRGANRKRGKQMKRFLFATGLLLAGAAAADAGVIDRACASSERGAGKRALCGCIQQVADVTLDRSDQRMAAKFFRDPHQAQVVRQSDRRDHSAFWQRYKKFGATAEAYCRG